MQKWRLRIAYTKPIETEPFFYGAPAVIDVEIEAETFTDAAELARTREHKAHIMYRGAEVLSLERIKP